jgi:RNA polymerase sigma factor (sigma-70 family)
MRKTVSPETISAAVAGDRASLEAIVLSVQDAIYGIAIRMLWHPEDASDATQEILIRVVTQLGSFKGESNFLTWVYRIAVNHLLNIRKSRLESQNYTFSRFALELDQGLEESIAADEISQEEMVLIEEIKIGCTLGMLTCLSRDYRLAYILGEILEMESPEAAFILEISEGAYRKRLSRARSEIIEFTRQKCGLVNEKNHCHCRKRVQSAVRAGRVDPEKPLFARSATEAERKEIIHRVKHLEEMRRIAAIYRSHPRFRAPEDFARAVRELTRAEDG